MPGKRFASWAAGALLLAALVLVGRAVMVARQAGGGAVNSQVRYATGTVERGGIRVTVSGTGTAAFPDRQVLSPQVDGTVAAVHVHAGQTVKKGQLLVTLTNEDLTAAADVTAPSDGRIVSLRVQEGAQVQKGAVLADLVDSGALEFVAQVYGPERDQIRPGQAAEVKVDDFDGQVPGRVIAVGDREVAGPSSLYYEVRIALDNPGLFRAGMTGQAAIRVPGTEITRRGTVEWAARTALLAPMGGRVERLDAAEGRRVRAGERIARIVNATYTAGELKEMLVIRAPFDGVVLAVNARAGDRLAGAGKTGAPGGTAEPVVIAGGDVTVTAAVDEMDVARVRAGQAADVTFAALPGRTFSGTVEQVALEGRSQNGVTTYDVLIRVQKPEGVRAGMSATASILVERKEDVLLVPAEAVVDSQQGTAVRVLTAAGPQTVPVKIGLRNDRVAEVLSGLRAGDTVVLAEYDPSAAATQGPAGQRGGFGPGGFPAGGLLVRPGGFGGGRGGGRAGGAAGGVPR